MRIDQRKKWYQKIKYNKNFKVVSFITVILVFVVGYMIMTGRGKVGDGVSEPITRKSPVFFVSYC